jgi:hypothetical protein
MLRIGVLVGTAAEGGLRTLSRKREREANESQIPLIMMYLISTYSSMP